jgi:hypothetical protein
MINAKRKEIQVLGSTGPKDRNELFDTASFYCCATTLLFL